MRTKQKDERTADIHTIFTKGTYQTNPETGTKLAGHYCLVCRYVFSPYLNM